MQNPQTIQLQLVRVQEHGAINTRLRGRGTDLILSILGPQVGQAVGLAFAVPRTQQERLCRPFSFLRSHFAKSPEKHQLKKAGPGMFWSGRGVVMATDCSEAQPQ